MSLAETRPVYQILFWPEQKHGTMLRNSMANQMITVCLCSLQMHVSQHSRDSSCMVPVHICHGLPHAPHTWLWACRLPATTLQRRPLLWACRLPATTLAVGLPAACDDLAATTLAVGLPAACNDLAATTLAVGLLPGPTHLARRPRRVLGDSLGAGWDNCGRAGTILGQYWGSAGTLLGQYWDNTGTVLGCPL